MSLFDRDAAGCVTGCDWPRSRCYCPPKPYWETFVEVVLATGIVMTVVGALVGVVTLAVIGLKTLLT